MRRLIGPMNFALHHDCGVLVDGFDSPPSMMMTYNKRYYANLFEVNGFRKLRDLFTFELLSNQDFPPQIARIAERVRNNYHVRVRPLRTGKLEADLEHIREIFETTLRPGLGFAPIRKAELTALLHRLRPMVLSRPELSLVAEAEGNPVGFCITLPDGSLALREAQGYLFPFGLAKLLWAARRIDRLRVLFFGIRAGWRRRGVESVLAVESLRRARELGYASAELGWTFEDDKATIRTIKATGAQRIKTYRLYERAL